MGLGGYSVADRGVEGPFILSCLLSSILFLSSQDLCPSLGLPTMIFHILFSRLNLQVVFLAALFCWLLLVAFHEPSRFLEYGMGNGRSLAGGAVREL